MENNISRKIKQLRKKKGCSLRAVAEFMGISINYVWQLENGKCNVSLKVLDKISKFFNVSKHYFINDDGDDFDIEKELFLEKFKKLCKEDQEKIGKIIDIFFEEREKI